MAIKQNLFKRYFDFDGKRYEIHAIRNTGARADRIAESLRARGYLARVVQYSRGVSKWAVYKRRAD